MADWQNIPAEVLTEIFMYLPRRDRLSCSMVCRQWEDALDYFDLWNNMVIHIDTDLTEPSTIILTRYFHRYIKSLEIGWAFPQRPSRWLPFKHKELTKRAVRLFNILNDSFVQLTCIKIFDWFDIFRFKKIIYHLTRFLARQGNLQKIVFYNANLHKSDCIKLLTACLSSKQTIRYLDIHNYHYYQSAFDSVEFLSLLEQLPQLCVLKLDYFVLSRGVIDAILTSDNRNLSFLDISIRETDTFGHVISEAEWNKLTNFCPKLRVSFTIRNICHYEDISLFLKPSIRLSSFSIFTSKTWDQSRSRQFRRTLYLLLKQYNNTLEFINLQLRNNKEMLDDIILSLVKKCPNLKGIDFHGVIKNIQLIRELCKCQLDCDRNLKHFKVLPKVVNEDNHNVLRRIYSDYETELIRNNMEFKIINNTTRNLVYVYY